MEFLALHALRVKGFAEPEGVAAMYGVDEGQVAPVLDDLVRRKLAVRRSGRISGYALTAAGRQRHRDLLARDAGASTSRDAVGRAYRTFLTLNQPFLMACTAWQLHPEEQPTLVAELGRIDENVQPICEELSAELPRFERYGPRMVAARARVDAGDGDWFTRPGIDSYHTVWFELHEDLLCTLGIERSTERDPTEEG
jgi:DNA-binding PadR family transcriptional regulator